MLLCFICNILLLHLSEQIPDKTCLQTNLRKSFGQGSALEQSEGQYQLVQEKNKTQNLRCLDKILTRESVKQLYQPINKQSCSNLNTSRNRRNESGAIQSDTYENNDYKKGNTLKSSNKNICILGNFSRPNFLDRNINKQIPKNSISNKNKIKNTRVSSYNKKKQLNFNSDIEDISLNSRWINDSEEIEGFQFPEIIRHKSLLTNIKEKDKLEKFKLKDNDKFLIKPIDTFGLNKINRILDLKSALLKAINKQSLKSKLTLHQPIITNQKNEILENLSTRPLLRKMHHSKHRFRPNTGKINLATGLSEAIYFHKPYCPPTRRSNQIKSAPEPETYSNKEININSETTTECKFTKYNNTDKENADKLLKDKLALKLDFLKGNNKYTLFLTKTEVTRRVPNDDDKQLEESNFWNSLSKHQSTKSLTSNNHNDKNISKYSVLHTYTVPYNKSLDKNTNRNEPIKIFKDPSDFSTPESWTYPTKNSTTNKVTTKQKGHSVRHKTKLRPKYQTKKLEPGTTQMKRRPTKSTYQTMKLQEHSTNYIKVTTTNIEHPTGQVKKGTTLFDNANHMVDLPSVDYDEVRLKTTNSVKNSEYTTSKKQTLKVCQTLRMVVTTENETAYSGISEGYKIIKPHTDDRQNEDDTCKMRKKVESLQRRNKKKFTMEEKKHEFPLNINITQTNNIQADELNIPMHGTKNLFTVTDPTVKYTDYTKTKFKQTLYRKTPPKIETPHYKATQKYKQAYLESTIKPTLPFFNIKQKNEKFEKNKTSSKFTTVIIPKLTLSYDYVTTRTDQDLIQEILDKYGIPTLEATIDLTDETKRQTSSNTSKKNNTTKLKHEFKTTFKVPNNKIKQQYNSTKLPLTFKATELPYFYRHNLTSMKTTHPTINIFEHIESKIDVTIRDDENTYSNTSTLIILPECTSTITECYESPQCDTTEIITEKEITPYEYETSFTSENYTTTIESPNQHTFETIKNNVTTSCYKIQKHETTDFNFTTMYPGTKKERTTCSITTTQCEEKHKKETIQCEVTSSEYTTIAECNSSSNNITEYISSSDDTTTKECIVLTESLTSKECTISSESKATTECTTATNSTTTTECKESSNSIATTECKETSNSIATTECLESSNSIATTECKESSNSTATAECKESSNSIATTDCLESSNSIATSECLESSNSIATTECKESSNNTATTECREPSNSIATTECKESSNSTATTECLESSNSIATSEYLESSNGIATTECKESSNNIATTECLESSNSIATTECKESSNSIATTECKVSSNSIVTTNCKVSSNSIATAECTASLDRVATTGGETIMRCIETTETTTTPEKLQNNNIMECDYKESQPTRETTECKSTIEYVSHKKETSQCNANSTCKESKDNWETKEILEKNFLNFFSELYTETTECSTEKESTETTSLDNITKHIKFKFGLKEFTTIKNEIPDCKWKVTLDWPDYNGQLEHISTKNARIDAKIDIFNRENTNETESRTITMSQDPNYKIKTEIQVLNSESNNQKCKLGSLDLNKRTTLEQKFIELVFKENKTVEKPIIVTEQFNLVDTSNVFKMTKKVTDSNLTKLKLSNNVLEASPNESSTSKVLLSVDECTAESELKTTNQISFDAKVLTTGGTRLDFLKFNEIKNYSTQNDLKKLLGIKYEDSTKATILKDRLIIPLNIYTKNSNILHKKTHSTTLGTDFNITNAIHKNNNDYNLHTKNSFDYKINNPRNDNRNKYSESNQLDKYKLKNNQTKSNTKLHLTNTNFKNSNGNGSIQRNLSTSLHWIFTTIDSREIMIESISSDLSKTSEKNLNTFSSLITTPNKNHDLNNLASTNNYEYYSINLLSSKCKDTQIALPVYKMEGLDNNQMTNKYECNNVTQLTISRNNSSRDLSEATNIIPTANDSKIISETSTTSNFVLPQYITDIAVKTKYNSNSLFSKVNTSNAYASGLTHKNESRKISSKLSEYKKSNSILNRNKFAFNKFQENSIDSADEISTKSLISDENKKEESEQLKNKEENMFKNYLIFSRNHSTTLQTHSTLNSLDLYEVTSEEIPTTCINYESNISKMITEIDKNALTTNKDLLNCSEENSSNALNGSQENIYSYEQNNDDLEFKSTENYPDYVTRIIFKTIPNENFSGCIVKEPDSFLSTFIKLGLDLNLINKNEFINKIIPQGNIGEPIVPNCYKTSLSSTTQCNTSKTTQPYPFSTILLKYGSSITDSSISSTTEFNIKNSTKWIDLFTSSEDQTNKQMKVKQTTESSIKWKTLVKPPIAKTPTKISTNKQTKPNNSQPSGNYTELFFKTINSEEHEKYTTKNVMDNELNTSTGLLNNTTIIEPVEYLNQANSFLLPTSEVNIIASELNIKDNSIKQNDTDFQKNQDYNCKNFLKESFDQKNKDYSRDNIKQGIDEHDITDSIENLDEKLNVEVIMNYFKLLGLDLALINKTEVMRRAHYMSYLPQSDKDNLTRQLLNKSLEAGDKENSFTELYQKFNMLSKASKDQSKEVSENNDKITNIKRILCGVKYDSNIDETDDKSTNVDVTTKIINGKLSKNLFNSNPQNNEVSSDYNKFIINLMLNFGFDMNLLNKTEVLKRFENQNKTEIDKDKEVNKMLAEKDEIISTAETQENIRAFTTQETSKTALRECLFAEKHCFIHQNTTNISTEKLLTSDNSSKTQNFSIDSLLNFSLNETDENKGSDILYKLPNKKSHYRNKKGEALNLTVARNDSASAAINISYNLFLSEGSNRSNLSLVSKLSPPGIHLFETEKQLTTEIILQKTENKHSDKTDYKLFQKEEINTNLEHTSLLEMEYITDVTTKGFNSDINTLKGKIENVNTQSTYFPVIGFSLYPIPGEENETIIKDYDETNMDCTLSSNASPLTNNYITITEDSRINSQSNVQLMSSLVEINPTETYIENQIYSTSNKDDSNINLNDIQSHESQTFATNFKNNLSTKSLPTTNIKMSDNKIAKASKMNCTLESEIIYFLRQNGTKKQLSSMKLHNNKKTQLKMPLFNSQIIKSNGSLNSLTNKPKPLGLYSIPEYNIIIAIFNKTEDQKQPNKTGGKPFGKYLVSFLTDRSTKKPKFRFRLFTKKKNALPTEKSNKSLCTTEFNFGSLDNVSFIPATIYETITKSWRSKTYLKIPFLSSFQKIKKSDKNKFKKTKYLTGNMKLFVPGRSNCELYDEHTATDTTRITSTEKILERFRMQTIYQLMSTKENCVNTKCLPPDLKCDECVQI